MYSARIITDSISPDDVRLTTFEITIPRFILAEFNTHRMLSRNSASSRAIPIQKMIDRVMDEPFIPMYWGKNKKGMQATEEIAHYQAQAAEEAWLGARDSAVSIVRELSNMGVHKQTANRLLEPFMWQTILVTATEWDNFLNLRTHPDAQPEFQVVAKMMDELLQTQTPAPIDYNEWHCPLTQPEEEWVTEQQRIMASIGRCARVSYLTHDGKRDPQADIDLAKRLLVSGHMSPFEHVARPAEERFHNEFIGNFRGWVQYRKTIMGEENILAMGHE